MSRSAVLSAVCAIVLGLASVTLGTVYVATTGSDLSGDGSAGNPYKTIQKGISEAPPGETVQAAAGTYVENITFLGKAITVTSSNPDNPAVVASTIIDGGQADSVVFFTSGETASSVLTGFKITNGRGNEGGGIYCTSSPTITQNIVTDNEATAVGYYKGGGGICVRGGSPVIDGNTITDNYGYMGGGVACYESPNVTLTDNTITDNDAYYGGGGVCYRNSSGLVENNTITGNYTENWDGGGVLVQHSSTVSISNNLIKDNTANGGAGIGFQEGGQGSVTGNVICGNIAKEGGGAGVLCATNGTVPITGNVVCGNLGVKAGGGGILCIGQGSSTIKHCTIAQNTAMKNAGGGLATEWGYETTVSNCIFAANTAPNGNQLSLGGSGPILTISYSDVEGGPVGVYNDGGTLNWLSGNMNADPLFAALGSWNDNGTPTNYLDDTWNDGDYHVKSAEGRWDPAAGGGAGAWVTDAVYSPCIDAADPAAPWASEPNPNGARANMGAYGNTPVASKSPGIGLTMAAVPSDCGTLSPEAGAHRVSAGAPVPIQATAMPFAQFLNWSAAPSGNAAFGDANAASTTVTVTGTVTVTAHFLATVTDPVFSPVPGAYAAPIAVSITCGISGAVIHYTTDGGPATGSSPTYTGPIGVSTNKTIRAIAAKTGWVDSNEVIGIYRIDTQGPVVTGVSTVPTVVREGTDLSLTLVATADDSARGASNTAQAEHWMGPDPGEGSGTAMAATDGIFSSQIEGITGSLNTTAWTIGTYRIYLRAADVLGNWGSPAYIDVQVVDGTPPGTITDLSAVPVALAPRFDRMGITPADVHSIPMGSFEEVAVTIHDYSSAEPPNPADAVLDEDASTIWRTAGTVSEETEYIVLDTASVKEVGAVYLLAATPRTLFPAEFQIEVSQDASSWTPVAAAAGFKAPNRACFWQFESVDARYVKISGPGLYDRRDRLYHWEIAEAGVYAGGGALVQLTWTAPADDGYAGLPASEYDLRCSRTGITAANFGGCQPLPGPAAPKAPGAEEQVVVDVGLVSGTVYLAVKAADDVPNWSAMSNVAQTTASIPGFAPLAPADGASAQASPAPVFEFIADSSLKPVFINFSSSFDFVRRPTRRPDGQVDRTLRYPVRPGASSWQPSRGQWKAIKRIVCSEGVLYWRLEGRSSAREVYGPPRSLYFDCGEIPAIAVTPSHPKDSDEAIWPDRDALHTFYWANATTGMKYFYIDISTDPGVPITDRKKTVILGGAGITDTMYIPKKPEWKKIRKLATWLAKPNKPAPAEGVLYWRVRARDADRLLSCASAVKKLVVDGGTWTLSDLDLGAATPTVTWAHAGQGIVKYCLQFSPDGTFFPRARDTLKVPVRSVTDTFHVFGAGEVRRLKAFATRHGVTMLYYRVQGEDADRSFITYSEAKTTPVP